MCVCGGGGIHDEYQIVEKISFTTFQCIFCKAGITTIYVFGFQVKNAVSEIYIQIQIQSKLVALVALVGEFGEAI